MARKLASGAEDTKTFSDFLVQEHSRLQQQRDEAIAARAEVEQELESIVRELHAIDVYERAKQGKLPAAGRGARRGGGRGGKRRAVLDVIRSNPAGMSRGEILTALGLKGDKSGEQSVSNALTALKKANRVISRLGKYVAA